MTNAQERKLLNLGFNKAEKITRKFAKTFYLGSLFLPRDIRRASFCIYAICQASDEAVDASPNINNPKQLAKVHQDIILAFSDAPLKNPLLLAFRKTITQYDIPRDYFEELISGMQMDLEKSRYTTFDELYTYSYKAAGVVGLIMQKIFSMTSPKMQNFAIDLGIAFQLTNILRDIREDYERGRIYLPQDEMRHFGVTEQDITQGRNTENFKKLMRFQIKRNKQYYTNSALGIKLIPDRKIRRCVLIMKDAYMGILDEIERVDFDVFRRRAGLNHRKKILLTIKLLFHKSHS